MLVRVRCPQGHALARVVQSDQGTQLVTEPRVIVQIGADQARAQEAPAQVYAVDSAEPVEVGCRCSASEVLSDEQQLRVTTLADQVRRGDTKRGATLLLQNYPAGAVG